MSTLNLTKTSTIIKLAQAVKSEFNTHSLESDGVEFKQVTATTQNIGNIVNASIMGNSAGIVLASFIRGASKADVSEYFNSLEAQALILGFDATFVSDCSKRFFHEVSKQRATFGKDLTFLPFEDAASCLQREKGTASGIKWGDWVDNSWVMKAIYASAKSEKETETETAQGGEGEVNKTQEVSMVDRVFNAAATLEINDLIELQNRINALVSEKQSATA
jgi:hypothetical protein